MSIRRALVLAASLAAALVALAATASGAQSSSSSLQLRSELRSAVSSIAGPGSRVRCAIKPGGRRPCRTARPHCLEPAVDWRVGLHEIPSYHSPDCYYGGPLDFHPDSSDWPN
jgi:hypothetical protein